MITSHALINKNSASKIYEAFNGIVDARVTTALNVRYSALVEVTVFVKTPGADSYVLITRSGALSTDVNQPILLDSNGKSIARNTFYCGTAGMFTLYMDTQSFVNLQYSIGKTGSGAGADISVSFALYSEKFTAMEYLKGKGVTDFSKAQNIRVTGLTSTGSISYSTLPTNRFIFITADLFQGGSVSSHYFVRIKNSAGETIYPVSYDVNTGQQVSYGNGQVSLAVNRNTYIDLYRYDAVELTVVRSLNDANIVALISAKGFGDTLPAKEAGGIEDILLEGERFKFVKTTAFTDAWDNLITSKFSTGVYLSDDLGNPTKQTISAASVIAAENGASIARVSLVPYDPAMQNTSKSSRINIVMSNGAVYHNYANGGGIDSWAKTKFWEQRGSKRKIPVKTLAEVTPLHRYDPTLPQERYDRNSTITAEGFTFVEYQEKPNFTYLGPLCRTKKMVLWGSYLVTGERIGVWMTTDGGANYVLVYDFIDGLALLPNPVNTIAFEAYSGGLTIKKVNMVYPSATDKEPANPFTYADLPAITGISNGADTVVTIPAHGLITGDIVLFTGTAQNNDWKALTCDEFTSSGFKQNVYSVNKLTDNSFALKTYIGSYDTPLRARHVHSINECIGGAVVSTGEEHPNGWFLYLNQRLKDASTVVNAFNYGKNANIFRLNSSAEGLQRACGFLIDNASDPNVIFNCDTSNKNMGTIQIAGRSSGLPAKSSNGIWKGKLSNIDDWSKFECVADIPEPAIWMYRYNGIIVGYYQLGGMVVSTDDGNTWQYFPKGSSIFSGVFKDKIVIGNGYIFEWKK